MRFWGLFVTLGLGIAAAASAEDLGGFTACADTLTGAPERAKAILVARCGKCHSGPWLDFSKYPFFSDAFPSERELVVESIRRARLEGFKRMPPVNYPPLTAEEIATLEAWLATMPTP